MGAAACPSSEGHGHEIVAKRRRVLNRCCVGNGLAVRPGSVANRNRRRHLASRRHGQCTEARSKASRIEAGGKDGDISPDIFNRSPDIFNQSNVIGCARFSTSEAC
jgi:hypothetical protein